VSKVFGIKIMDLQGFERDIVEPIIYKTCTAWWSRVENGNNQRLEAGMEPI
jgi:hypothetical protein